MTGEKIALEAKGGGRGCGRVWRERKKWGEGIKTLVFSKSQFHLLFILQALMGFGGADWPNIVSSHMTLDFNTMKLLCIREEFISLLFFSE